MTIGVETAQKFAAIEAEGRRANEGTNVLLLWYKQQQIHSNGCKRERAMLISSRMWRQGYR